MHPTTRRAAALCSAVLLLAGCQKTIEGPTPAVAATHNPLYPTKSPAQVCNAQAATTGWTLHLDGRGFAPLPVNVLSGEAQVAMPVVTLAGPETFELPRDRVAFVSATRLTIAMPTSETSPAHALPPGLYDVTVRNPSGREGSTADALEVVPPPTLSSATDDGTYSSAADSTLRLTGTNFRAADVPAIRITSAGQPEVTLTNVTVVSATEVTATLPAGTAPGTYDVHLTNPEGCAAVLPQGLVLSEMRLGTLRVDPKFGYQHSNTSVTIYNAPVGTEAGFSGGAPQLHILAPLKSAPETVVSIPLRREAFVSAGAITAVIPTCSGLSATPASAADCANGIVPGGPYAITVRDPSGATGTIPASAGFVVLTNPPPTISSISPAAIDTQGITGAQALVITGTNFGDAAQPQIVSQLASGNLLVCDLPIVSQAGATELQAHVPTSIALESCDEYDALGNQVTTSTGFQLSEGQYLVRVQNSADIAFADFSALVVRNPSADPQFFGTLDTRLATARADFRLVEGRDDLGNSYLYALGGSDGSADLASIEVAQITPFGDLGGDCSADLCRFRTLDRTPLPEARSGHVAFSATDASGTGWLFVIGGRSGSATLASTVRAQILRAADAPDLAEPTATQGALAAGTWYYRVSAVMGGAFAANPNGETLASDEQPHTTTSEAGGAALTWTCVPGAESYRVYRTAEANAASGSSVLLATVPAAATCTGEPLPTESYVDDGSATVGTERPLPAGAIGNWVQQGVLQVHRSEAALERVGDTVYVAGGLCAQEADGCITANTTLNTVEAAMFDPATAALSDFVEVSTFNTARRRLHLALANASTAPAHFTAQSPDNRNDAWLVAVGGLSATATLTSNVFEVAKVTEDGAAVVTPTFSVATYSGTQGFRGGWAYVVANQLVATAVNATGSLSSKADDVCTGQCDTSSDFAGTLNNTKITEYTTPNGLRFLNGNTLFRAFIYVAGGFSSLSTSGTPSDSLERFTY